MGGDIKAIIFDCYGVLTTDKWKQFHASLSGDTYIKASQLNDQYDQGIISSEQFYSLLSDATNLTIDELKTHIGGDNYKNSELINLIKKIKQNYKIGLISNAATNWIRTSFLSAEEIQFFDSLILSYEVGLIKQDPQIFELACSQLGVNFNQILFIDDNDYYCEQAKKLGINTINYIDNEQLNREIRQFIEF